MDFTGLFFLEIFITIFIFVSLFMIFFGKEEDHSSAIWSLGFFFIVSFGIMLDPGSNFSNFIGVYIIILSIVFSIINYKKMYRRTASTTDTSKHIDKEKASIQNTTIKNVNSIGITDIELFKKELYDLFIKYENAYSNFDYMTLSLLCTDDHFHTICNGLDSLKKYDRKNIYENINLNNFEITDVSNTKSTIEIHVSIDISLNDYTIDTRNNIYIKGNKNSPIQKILNVCFVKNSKSSIKRSCPNCGAPINSRTTKCSYCNTTFFGKNTWQIDSVITSKTNII